MSLPPNFIPLASKARFSILLRMYRRQQSSGTELRRFRTSILAEVFWASETSLPSSASSLSSSPASSASSSLYSYSDDDDDEGDEEFLPRLGWFKIYRSGWWERSQGAQRFDPEYVDYRYSDLLAVVHEDEDES